MKEQSNWLMNGFQQQNLTQGYPMRQMRLHQKEPDAKKEWVTVLPSPRRTASMPQPSTLPRRTRRGQVYNATASSESTGRHAKPHQMDFPADDCRARVRRHDDVAPIPVTNAATGTIAEPNGKRRAQPQSNDMLKLPERINLHGVGLRRSDRLRQLRDKAQDTNKRHKAHVTFGSKVKIG